MKKEVTKRQKELLRIIYDSYKNIGYPPNFEEMREKLGVASNQGVLDLLRALEQKRLVRRESRSARGVTILPLGYQILEKKPLIPFAGVTSAGPLLENIEVEGDWKTISPEIAKYQSNIFLLRVSGDSMINAGINDGDMVVVKEDKEFASGDIVLADCNGESTIKRFISEDAPPYVYLKPENPAHGIRYFTDDTRLVGKIIAVMNQSGEWKKLK